MCEEVMHVRSAAFLLIRDRLKTQEMCIRAVKVDPWQLYDVPDWFVVLQKMWHEDFHDDDDDDDDDDEIIKWYDGYKKTQGSKSKNKRRTFTHCLASIKVFGLVYVWRQKEGMQVTDSCS